MLPESVSLDLTKLDWPTKNPKKQWQIGVCLRTSKKREITRTLLWDPAEPAVIHLLKLRRMHRVLDITFGEDASRLRNRDVGENLGFRLDSDAMAVVTGLVRRDRWFYTDGLMSVVDRNAW